jgi:thioredoxin-dependent peroxiredoxin
MMYEERIGEAYELGDQLTVIGSRLGPGDRAPELSLDVIDPATGAIKPFHLSDSAGKVRLLNVVNSVDTSVCSVETNKWEKLRQQLPADVEIYTVSMDLPFALARWQNAEGVTHAMLSGHKSEKFGQEYGVLIKEWRMLQRAVFIIDRSDHIAYAEYVRDQMTEPDYDKAVEAAKKVADGQPV